MSFYTYQFIFFQTIFLQSCVLNDKRLDDLHFNHDIKEIFFMCSMYVGVSFYQFPNSDFYPFNLCHQNDHHLLFG